jgi:hypothetical protein
VDRTRRVGRAGELDCAKVVGGARQGWTVHEDRARVDRATRVVQQRRGLSSEVFTVRTRLLSLKSIRGRSRPLGGVPVIFVALEVI